MLEDPEAIGLQFLVGDDLIIVFFYESDFFFLSLTLNFVILNVFLSF